MHNVSVEDVKHLIEQNIFVPIPYFFNLNYRPLTNLIGEPLKIRQCERFFFVDFEQNATEETKNYFG